MEKYGIVVLSSPCRKKGLAPKAIHADMVATLGDDVPALPKGQKRTAYLGLEWRVLKMTESLDVLQLPPQKKIDCIYHMLMDDRLLTIIQIANAIRSSTESVENHNQ